MKAGEGLYRSLLVEADFQLNDINSKQFCGEMLAIFANSKKICTKKKLPFGDRVTNQDSLDLNAINFLSRSIRTPVAELFLCHIEL